MATPNVLTFDAEGRAVDFESGASPAPAADGDATIRSQWATRDAAARLAVRRHLPTAERAHFSQYKSAKTLYDAVVARYSSPATAALSRLILPYLFPDLAAFPTVADLITLLCTSDIRYRAALPAEFCAKNPPLMGAPPPPSCPLLPLLLRPTSLVLSRSARRLPLAGDAAPARARGARALEELAGAVEAAVEAAEGVGVAVGVVAGVGALVAAVEAAVVAVRAEVADVEAVVEVAATELELVGAALRSGSAPVVVSASSSSSALVRPRPPSSFVSGTLRVSGVGVLAPVPTSYVLQAQTTTRATPLRRAATSSTATSAASTTSAASATAAASAPSATTAASFASTVATDTSTPATTPTTTPTPSTASTTTSTAPTGPPSALALLALAGAALPARDRRSADRIEANEFGRSSRSNRGQDGGGRTPLKDGGPGRAGRKGGSAARLVGGSAARLLGGAAARRLGCRAAGRLGGWAARLLGVWAAGRLGSSAAGRRGGSAAWLLGGSAAQLLGSSAARLSGASAAGLLAALKVPVETATGP
ncbi:unnamed protein product [Closterium sp. NIES-65]|nr:unnamed protein product [Closterium sp. NIES-65]